MQQNIFEVIASMDAAVSKLEKIAKDMKNQAACLSSINEKINELRNQQNSVISHDKVWFPEDSPTRQDSVPLVESRHKA
jgi:hypothetical protein